MKKSIMIIISVIIILLVLFALFFYIKQENILFHPTTTAQEHQYKFPEAFTENFYKTPNDGVIHSLRFLVSEPKGIVLYLHGNAGCLIDWGWVYPQYTTRNYDVEIIDFRTYGKSIGKLSEANMHNDVAFIYKELQKEYAEENIIIHGRSIGTGMATKLASENNPKALILESPYFNIADMAKRMFPFFPADLFLKYHFRNNVYLQNTTAPIYILHGTEDNIVPFSSGKKLYDSVAEKATLITFEEGTHSNLSTYKKYQQFLDEVLK